MVLDTILLTLMKRDANRMSYRLIIYMSIFFTSVMPIAANGTLACKAIFFRSIEINKKFYEKKLTLMGYSVAVAKRIIRYRPELVERILENP